MSACPRCQTQLVHGAHGGWTAWGCRNCGGAWLDAQTARSLLAPLTDLGVETQLRSNLLRCPVCTQAMGPRQSATAAVEIDECPPHGVWFDHDELVRVSATVSHLRSTEPSQAQRAFAQWGPPVAAGVALGAVGAAAVADDPNRQSVDLGGATDAALYGTELVAETGAAAGELAGDAAGAAAEGAGGMLEAAGGAADVAGAVLEGVLSVVGGIFEGLS